MTITISQLTNVADDFLQEEYSIHLNVPIKLNGRLSKALGRFVYINMRSKGVVADRIELSKHLLAHYTEEEIIDVLKHELIHYACFMLGKPHSDGDAYFENELKRLGVTQTGVYKHKGKAHVYACKCCEKIIAKRVRRFSHYHYRTGCCSANIIYKGTEII